MVGDDGEGEGSFEKGVGVVILTGHWIDELKNLDDGEYHCCCTSPPYYGLRSYLDKNHPLKMFELGCESTPEEYVQKLVLGFKEVKRVLRDDGVLWLNLGDSYAANRAWQCNSTKGGPKRSSAQANGGSSSKAPHGLKPKDLIGIPWMVAFALRADGWYLRSAMPWVKRNPMPESVLDRPGNACEMVFLMSKSEKYFYDSEAVKMDGKIPAGTRGAKGSEERSSTNGVNSRPPEYKIYSGKRNRRNSDNFWDTWQGLYSDEDSNPLAFVVNTYPYPKAHFATWPPKLVEPMIKSSTSEKGCCELCGSPQERIVERKPTNWDGSKYGERAVIATGGAMTGGVVKSTLGSSNGKMTADYSTAGWKPTCGCDCGFEPCRVLDPFGGSGTTASVAKKLGRSFTTIDLNPEYAPLMIERTTL